MNPFIVGTLIGAGISLVSSLFSDDDSEFDEVTQESVEKEERELVAEKRKWEKYDKKCISPIMFKIVDVNFCVRESELENKKAILSARAEQD